MLRLALTETNLYEVEATSLDFTAVQAALNAFATAPFPANFAALAAALAAVASLGVSIGGSSISGGGQGAVGEVEDARGREREDEPR